MKNKKWRKIDNTAKIFTLDSNKNRNVFRYSVILKNNVDIHILKKALNKSLKHFEAFRVRIKFGLFWNYFEYNSLEPIIYKEEDITCKYTDFKENNNYLFRVSYSKKKINLDIFHGLTDGVGASIFLKEIIKNYLDLKYDLDTLVKEDVKEIQYEDEYIKNYDKKLKGNKRSIDSYQLDQVSDRSINNTSHYIIPVNELKQVCKKYGVTITEYLGAIYIYSIYMSLYDKTSNKEITITLPVDLRKLYQVNTLSNFFVSMTINSKIVENKLTTFEEILEQVHNEFRESINKFEINKRLTEEIKLGNTYNMIPLFIKKPFMMCLGLLFNKSTTTTLSNVGIMDIDNKYKKYIDNILVLVMPGRLQKIKCTITSFGDKLNVIINSNIDDNKFNKVFLKQLKKEISKIKLENNCYVVD